MDEVQNATVAADLEPETAEREIRQAVSARHRIARRYVLRLRRRNPDASPEEIVSALERHYVSAITIAGGIVTAGTIAANVGIALIPGVAAGKEAGKGAAKVAAKGAAKAATSVATKAAARSVARTGAEHAVRLLPAGDEQLQFELTAVFALALAEIHSLSLDQEQAHALIYGLSNGRVSQQQIAQMATDLVLASEPPMDDGQPNTMGKDGLSHWANTLGETLPGGAAQALVRTVQTGKLETWHSDLNRKQQASVEYGVGALTGGVTRFVFGREVVEASRAAFAEAPSEFPEHLSDSLLSKSEEEQEPNRALLALEDAAKATGGWVSATAARSTRVFRSVDLDGDGVPDEAQALTAAKGLGNALTGAVSSGARVFRGDDNDESDGGPHGRRGLKGSGAAVASRLRRTKAADTDDASDDSESPTE